MTNQASADTHDTDVDRESAQAGARRPYTAPELVFFGTVEQFTRGGGTLSKRDLPPTTRKP